MDDDLDIDKLILRYLECQPDHYAPKREIEAFAAWCRDASRSWRLVQLFLAGHVGAKMDGAEPGWWLTAKGQAAAALDPRRPADE